MAKIFISYAREDVEIAEKIYDDLLRNDHSPWMDTRDMLPGEPWKEAIRSAIHDTAFFLALMSNHSINKRGFFQKELRMGVEILEEYPEGAVYMIPARIDDCEPKSDILRDINWVNLFPSYRKGVDSILASLEKSAPVNIDAVEDNQMADRYMKAISQFGDDKLAVRIGGIHALEKIAQAAPNRYHWAVMEVLCTYVREEAAYIPGEASEEVDGVATEIQAILDVLARRDHRKDKGKIIITKTNLNSARLNRAIFNNATLDYTNFSKANLFGAQLNGALLNWTLFRGTVLEEASLEGASLYNSNFRRAILRRANLCNAQFTGTDLSHSLLHGADLSAASNLTQSQINSAHGDEATKLPDGIVRPRSWLESRSEDAIPLGYLLDFIQNR
jgi:hypothetical protein